MFSYFSKPLSVYDFVQTAFYNIDCCSSPHCIMQLLLAEFDENVYSCSIKLLWLLLYDQSAGKHTRDYLTNVRY